MILAIATIYREADIIASTLTNLYNQGVDTIAVALSTQSDDGTREILADFPVILHNDDLPYHAQPHWQNLMMNTHASPGDWIIPFDADEYWYACAGITISGALNQLGGDQSHLLVHAHQHHDWNHRFETDGLPKVAFRYQPGAVIANGNHSVALPTPQQAWSGILALREISFRSYEHMRVKCHERTDRIDPAIPESEGAHQRVLAALTESELALAWEERCSRPMIVDPIPALLDPLTPVSSSSPSTATTSPPHV